MVDVVAVGLRALAYAAALLGAGLPMFIGLLRANLIRSAHRIRSIACPSAMAGLVLTLAHATVEPARLAGDWGGVTDLSLFAVLLRSDFGTTIAIRMLGLAMIAAAGLRQTRSADGFALIGAALIVVSFAFMGHTAADPQRWLLAPLLIAHLVAIAFWFGSLAPLLAATQYEDPAVAGEIVGRFSQVAICAVPAGFLVAVAMSGLLLPGLSSLSLPYGLLLVAKLVGFWALMGLAALNKWRFGPRLALGERSARVAFRRSVFAEWSLIAAVVTIAAAMTALYSPGH